MVDLAHLQPGQRVVYFIGPTLAGARDGAPVAAADAAWELAMAGMIDLSQRRLPNGETAYMATKRRVVDRAPVKPLISEAHRRRKAA